MNYCSICEAELVPNLKTNAHWFSIYHEPFEFKLTTCCQKCGYLFYDFDLDNPVKVPVGRIDITPDIYFYV